MSSTSKSRSHVSVLLRSAAAATLAIGGSQAMAQTTSVTLCVEPYTIDMPGTAGVPMWGYRELTSTSAACSSTPSLRQTAATPVITVPPGNTALAITLVNMLSVPTSIVLAGQALPIDGGAPVMAADLIGPACTPDPSAAPTAETHPQNCRVRSFTGETAEGASRTYNFQNLKPGTYLYQSGTHPQVQIQMGLFGMVKQDATLTGSTGRLLYANASAGFDVDVPVVLSEIDAAQHSRIAQTLGTAGNQAAWKAGGNSTFNYAPRYFLINGKVFDSTNAAASDLAVSGAGNGARVILRLANAGLQSRSLMLNSGTWKLLTEDGNPYAAAREQATALLPAGKTSDALIISSAPTDGSTSRTVALFDRRGGTDNGDGYTMGGQVARLAQTGPAVPFIAPVTNPVANEGSAFSLQLQGINITQYALTTAPLGMAINPATGLISWTVPTGTGVPTNVPVAVLGTGPLPPPATQSFLVRINHAPLVVPSAAQAVAHGTVTVAAPGVLAGATDPDGDAPLVAVQTGAVTAGALTLNADGSYTWTGPQPAAGSTAVTFSVAARDPFGLSSAAKLVTLNVAANVAPVAVNDAYTLTLTRVAGIAQSVTNAAQVAALTRPVSDLTANDTDDGSIVAATIARVQPVPPLVAPSTVTARRINPTGAGCPSSCPTINPGVGQAQASVTFNANGTFTLLPHTLLSFPTVGAGQTQVYEFRYTVRDDQNALSNQAIVRVTVQ